MDHAWRKSSYSVANSACVEVALAPGGAGVMMRDSQDAGGPVLTYRAAAWRAFIEDVRADRLRPSADR